MKNTTWEKKNNNKKTPNPSQATRLPNPPCSSQINTHMPPPKKKKKKKKVIPSQYLLQTKQCPAHAAIKKPHTRVQSMLFLPFPYLVCLNLPSYFSVRHSSLLNLLNPPPRLDRNKNPPFVQKAPDRYSTRLFAFWSLDTARKSKTYALRDSLEPVEVRIVPNIILRLYLFLHHFLFRH